MEALGIRHLSKTEFTAREAELAGNALNVNFDVVPIEELKRGMNVELEHGLVDPRTNVTNNDIIKTAKIAMAHFDEDVDYYRDLEIMEKNAEKRHKTSRNPDVFLV